MSSLDMRGFLLDNRASLLDIRLEKNQ